MRARWVLGRTALAICAWLIGVAPAPAAPSSPLSWQALNGPPGAVTHIAVDPQNRTQLYAVAGGRALYASSDSGAMWRAATNNLPPGAITAIYPDPSEPALWVATSGLTENGGRSYQLWRSANRGATWQAVTLSRNDLAIRRILRSKDQRSLYLGLSGTADGTGAQLLRSTDEGHSWQEWAVRAADTGLSGTLIDLLVAPGEPETLVATDSGGGVLRSDDGGESWTAVWANEAAGRLSLRVAGISEPSNALLLVQGAPESRPGEMQVARSGDGGLTWHRLAATGLPAATQVQALAGLPGDIYLAATDKGTYRSPDGGATWRLLEGPLAGGEVAELIPWPGSRTQVLAAAGQGVFVSRDAGALWQLAAQGLPFNSRVVGLLAPAQQPQRIYAVVGRAPGTDTPAPPLLLGSQDGGASWRALWPSLPALESGSWALGTGAAQLYVAADRLFFASSDGGLAWRVSSVPLTSTLVAASPSDRSGLFVLGLANGLPTLLRSRDNGAAWQEVTASNKAPLPPGQPTALTIHPTDANRLAVALAGRGTYSTDDGGLTWTDSGLGNKPVRWLAYGVTKDQALYAGIEGEGIYRRDMAAGEGSRWATATSGLPPGSTLLAFLADPRTPGTLWAARVGGGVYLSNDRGVTWTNAAHGMGDNQVLALAVDFSTPGGIFAGTETAGVWALRADARQAPAPQAVDARIEILWPHEQQPVATARDANIGLRLFQPGSLIPPPCTWTPRVTLWQAVDTSPAAPLGTANQRMVDGRAAPYWELNDVDVRPANDPLHKIYYMVQVTGANTYTSVWAHGTDPRTYFPQQDVPSGIQVGGSVDAVDARIQIVWPHDDAGNAQPVSKGTYANVAVALFKHGTRISVPVDWTPEGLTLYGAWNHEISRVLSREAAKQTRQSGAITYPVWEFQNIPVFMAADPANKLYLWVMADRVETFPTLWTHGADARTYFPAVDEPIQGCTP